MMKNIQRSLSDLLGPDYVRAVCEAQNYLTGTPLAELRRIAEEEVEFLPDATAAAWEKQLAKTGQTVVDSLTASSPGCGTAAFVKASNLRAAPLAASGPFRLGEDGRLRLIAKSEHYHASLGHHFPGYRLLDNANRIGVTNITHNNTRGHITRVLERELIRVANGLAPDDAAGLEQTASSTASHVLNRVINLETGSLATEAALKMMLMRFYRLDHTFSAPRYAGKTPVFLVMADFSGGPAANYHGTTILTQCLRGMWPELAAQLEAAGIFRVCPVGINDIAGFQAAVERFDHGACKIAGFFHELILMNYGGVKLTPEFVTAAHRLCHEHDIPVMIDEIQTGIWSPELFLFKEYGCHPDFVAVGKGFPGGLYPASKVLTTAEFDHLNQFGALVTNGQEELASLAYLVTMEFAAANRDHTRTVGRYYHEQAQRLAAEFPQLLDRVEGEAHMTTLFFRTAEATTRFAHTLTDRCGIDFSAQTYKADCPPAVLSKLPLITTVKTVDFIIARMRETLHELTAEQVQ